MHFLFIVLQNSSITLAGRILQIYYYFDFFLITSCQNPYVNLRKITLYQKYGFNKFTAMMCDFYTRAK